MTPSPEFIVRAYYLAWAEQDIERAISYMSDGVQWNMYIDTDVVGFAGQSIGREAMRQRMNDLMKSFELIAFEILNFKQTGQDSRTLVRCDYRHIASGQLLDLKIRSVFTVLGEHIVACDEYHDAERIRAFMALVSPPSKTTF